jgi:hypothetical protein
LKRDICGLKIPGTLIEEVDAREVEKCVPEALRYACVYWVKHLEMGGLVMLHDDGPVHSFLERFLLQWLEVLSLLRRTSDGVLMLAALESLLKV